MERKILWLEWFRGTAMSVNSEDPFPDVIKQKKKKELLLARRIFAHNTLLHLRLSWLTRGSTNPQASGAFRRPPVFVVCKADTSV